MRGRGGARTRHQLGSLLRLKEHGQLRHYTRALHLHRDGERATRSGCCFAWSMMTADRTRRQFHILQPAYAVRRDERVITLSMEL